MTLKPEELEKLCRIMLQHNATIRKQGHDLRRAAHNVLHAHLQTTDVHWDALQDALDDTEEAFEEAL